MRAHGGNSVPVACTKKALLSVNFENRLSSGDHAEARASVKVRGEGEPDHRPRDKADPASPSVLKKENSPLTRISRTKLHPHTSDPFIAPRFAVFPRIAAFGYRLSVMAVHYRCRMRDSCEGEDRQRRESLLCALLLLARGEAGEAVWGRRA
jgi:hypothetical protein